MVNKIVFIFIYRFGEYPILFEYCSILRARGNDVYYIGIGEKNEEFIDSSGVKVFHIGGTEIKSIMTFARFASDLVKKISPDLVHVFQFRGCALIPFFCQFSTRFLLDVRSVHVVGKSGGHSLLTPLKNRLTWIESLFFGYGIALTIEIKKMLQPAFKSIPVIPLGANFSMLQANSTERQLNRELIRSQLGLENNSTVLIYSGTINPIRKIDVLINAFKKVASKADDVYLIVAGHDHDNPKTLIHLKEKAKFLGIGNRVVFTGFLDYKLLIKYYHAADIGLCYIPHAPYFDFQPPTKLFEYMGAGLISVSTKTTAVKEIVQDGINGVLSGDTAGEYADSILRVLSGDIDRAKMATEINKLMEDFNWPSIIENHVVKYYKSIGLN